jgi:hypothetical protein
VPVPVATPSSYSAAAQAVVLPVPSNFNSPTDPSNFAPGSAYGK